MTDPAVDRLVDHLFRRQAGEMVAALTGIFGAARIDLAEDVVQDALLEALKRWRYGVPDSPRGWLIRVARNKALDRLRRDATLRRKADDIRQWARRAEPDAPGTDTNIGDEIGDDQLRMMFVCCHPDVPPDARVALTLKTLCGFGVSEIARAFLAPRSTIEKRLGRAKRRIRELGLPFEVPPVRKLSQRIDSVLEVLYLMFNEGYGAHEGASLIRPDLVGESIRLTSMLLRTPAMGLPKVHALLALELFQGARLSAKVGPLGDLVVLEQQDRAQWDRTMITAGFEHLRQAGRGPELTEYHLQAGIASCHAQAPDYERTNWTQILSMYDMLIDINPSPVVALNRAVAVMMTRGLDDGLRALDSLEDSPRLRDYYLLPATRAEMLRRAGHGDDAAQLFRRALTLACSEPEQRLLRERLKAVTNGDP